jgi:hypothetical protein
MKIKIVFDDKALWYKMRVVDAETGEHIEGVQKLSIVTEVGQQTIVNMSILGRCIEFEGSPEFENDIEVPAEILVKAEEKDVRI